MNVEVEGVLMGGCTFLSPSDRTGACSTRYIINIIVGNGTLGDIRLAYGTYDS